MGRFLLRRALGLVGVLLVMTALVFALGRVVPSDAARSLAGPSAPAETVAALRAEMGLDDPLAVQFGRYLAGLARGDLGTSVRTRQPVAADLRAFAPASLELMAAALLLGILAGLGAAAAQHLARGGAALRIGLLALGSVPIFLSALLLLLLFWFWLDWLPGSARIGIRRFEGPTGFMLLDGLLLGRWDVMGSALAHLALPSLALAIPVAVALARSAASSLEATLRQGFVRTARGKGLTEGRVLWAHAARNSAAAPLAMAGLQVGLLFANLLIVERIFAWPGLGLYAVQAFGASDLPAILGVSLAFGTFYVLVNALVDVGQALIDPRLRLG